MVVHHKLESMGAISVTAAGLGWIATLGSAVQFISGLIGVISGAIYLWTWFKSRQSK